MYDLTDNFVEMIILNKLYFIIHSRIQYNNDVDGMCIHICFLDIHLVSMNE